MALYPWIHLWLLLLQQSALLICEVARHGKGFHVQVGGSMRTPTFQVDPALKNNALEMIY